MDAFKSSYELQAIVQSYINNWVQSEGQIIFDKIKHEYINKMKMRRNFSDEKINKNLSLKALDVPKLPAQ